jgi:hypothetical protein
MRHRTCGLDRRGTYAPPARRVALTVAAAGLVVTAELLATLSAATPRTRHATHRMTVVAHPALPYEGEPQLSEHLTAPLAPRKAAVRVVLDYSAWSSGRLGAIPAQDATRRVIRLLEQAERHSISATADVTGSVRVGPVGAHGHVVTSTIGNFLVGRRGGSGWSSRFPAISPIACSECASSAAAGFSSSAQA